MIFLETNQGWQDGKNGQAVENKPHPAARNSHLNKKPRVACGTSGLLLVS